MITDDIMERILAKTDKDVGSGCWLYRGPTNAGGYGRPVLTIEGHRKAVFVH